MEPNLQIKGIILIYGIPGSGKSYFSQEIIPYLSINKNSKVIYFEIDKIELFFSKNLIDQEKFLNEICDIFDKITKKQNIVTLNEILKIYNEINPNTIQINELTNRLENDEIIDNFFDNLNWKLSRDFFFKLLEKISTLTDELDQNIFLIIDDNFLLKNMRKKYFQLCNKKKLGFCEILIDVSLEKALIQNKLREKLNQIPEKIIKNSFDKIEKFFTNNITIKSSENNVIHGIIDQLLKLLQNPVFIQNSSNEINVEYEKNFSHLLDIFCREKIGNLYKNSVNVVSENTLKKNNKIISELKKFFQNYANFLRSLKNDLDYGFLRKQYHETYEKIFSNKVNIKLEDIEEKIVSLIKENSLEFLSIEKEAQIFSNYFIEILVNNLLI